LKRFIQSFSFNLDILNYNISQLKRINKKINLKFIYLIRDPIEIINSIYHYNERNHAWGSQQVNNVNVLFDIQIKSLEFIEESQKIFPGILIDYDDLKKKYKVTLLKIFQFLWEHNKDLNNLNLEVSSKIGFLTNRSARININNKFWTKEEGLINMNSKTKYLLENNKVRIDELYGRYNKLKSV